MGTSFHLTFYRGFLISLNILSWSRDFSKHNMIFPKKTEN